MPRIRTGQLTLTTSAQQLTSDTVECSMFILKCRPTNSGPVYLGPVGVTAADGFILEVGEQFSYDFLNESGKPVLDLKPNEVYVLGTAGDKVSWFTSPM